MNVTLTRLLAAIAAAVLATLTLVIAIDPDGAEGPAAPRTITVQLGPIAKASPTVPDQLRVPATAVADVAKSSADDHDGSKSETPPGVKPQVLEAGREQQDRLAALDDLPVNVPLAAPTQAGCRSRFIGSYSSRRGVAPRLFVLHYTVSPNRPGWSDVDGITGYFARASTNASSNYVVDNEGHCNYIVPESGKAWTQAGFNPVSISVEQINTGREPTYAGTAGLAQTARIARDASKRWGIPLRRGRVSGCSVVTSGIVAHKDLGACGGGHFDISPYSVDQVIKAAKALDKPVRRITSVDRVTCRKLNWWRDAGRPHGKPEKNAVRRRKALDSRRVQCTSRGPVQR